MNKSALIGTVFGITVATAAAGIAGYSMLDSDSGSSTVAQNCIDEVIEQPREPTDERRIAGTVIGGLVGGAVGNDIGDSDITAVAGAAVGALAGNQAQKRVQEKRTDTIVETRCEPVRISR